MATATGIKNVSGGPLALPFPYEGLLPPGQMAVVADTPAQVQFVLGGAGFTQKLVQPIALPPTPLTQHGLPNQDETIITTGNSVANVNRQTSRFDRATAGGAMTPTLANGQYIGQRKRLVQSSAGGTVVITPATMAESKTAVTLTTTGDWAEVEWTATGWKVVGLGGPTPASYA